MGKIRVKTIGEETSEEEKKIVKQKKETKEAKKAAKSSEKRITEVEVKEEVSTQATNDVKDQEEKNPPTPSSFAEASEDKKATEGRREKKAKFKVADKKHQRSSRYMTAKNLVEEKKSYTLPDALGILVKMQNGKFDETVELHINTHSQGISGQVVLPHGSGKQTRVVIATDQIIADVEKGKIEFDVLVADPSMMPKLAKVARVLGPRGLMPNPKNGTITTKPEEVAKKYAGGQIGFKTEGKAPIIHLSVGKASFGEKKLEENIKTVISAIKKENIQKAVLKSTMSPAIKLAL